MGRCREQLNARHDEAARGRYAHRARRAAVAVLPERHERRRADKDVQRARAGEVRPEGTSDNDAEQPAFDGRSRQADESVQDDRDDHRLYAKEQPGSGLGRAVAHVGPRQAEDKDHRRSDEAGATDQQRRPSPAAPGEHHRHLSRGRPWQQARPADEVDELLFAHPATSHDKLRAHEGQVGGRTAEGGHAETQIGPGDLSERGGTGAGRLGRVLVLWRDSPRWHRKPPARPMRASPSTNNALSGGKKTRRRRPTATASISSVEGGR